MALSSAHRSATREIAISRCGVASATIGRGHRRPRWPRHKAVALGRVKHITVAYAYIREVWRLYSRCAMDTRPHTCCGFAAIGPAPTATLGLAAWEQRGPWGPRPAQLRGPDRRLRPVVAPAGCGSLRLRGRSAAACRRRLPQRGRRVWGRPGPARRPPPAPRPRLGPRGDRRGGVLLGVSTVSHAQNARAQAHAQALRRYLPRVPY